MKGDAEWVKKGLRVFSKHLLRERKRKDYAFIQTGHIAVRGKRRHSRMANIKGPDRRHRAVIGQKRQRGWDRDTEGDCQKNECCFPFHGDVTLLKRESVVKL